MASLRLNRNGKIGDSFDNITVECSGAEFKNRLAFGYLAGIDLGRLMSDRLNRAKDIEVSKNLMSRQ